MGKGENLAAEAVLAALYLRGAPHSQPVRKRRWGLVRDALLSDTPTLGQAAQTLRDRGLWDEALAVDSAGPLDWAVELVEAGRALTVANPRYPARWLRTLGACAPPAVWCVGQPSLAEPVSVVGSRDLSQTDRNFARSLGRRLMSEGRCLVSGGAIGADSETARGAMWAGPEGRLTLVLPYGLSVVAPEPGVCLLSVCEPNAPFTTGQAMERNTLIYAYSDVSVVVRARLKTGGTWTGATDALRRRLTLLAVRCLRGDEAAQSLCRLGGVPFRTASEVFQILKENVPSVEPALIEGL